MRKGVIVTPFTFCFSVLEVTYFPQRFAGTSTMPQRFPFTIMEKMY